MSVDVTCAHCAEAWDLDDLRHDSWAYLRPGSPIGVPSAVATLVHAAYTASENDRRRTAQQAVAAWVHQQVLSGAGCPACGFTHRGMGEYRARQLHELVIDAITDDDPTLFI